MNNRRQILIIILLIAVVGLGGLGVYIASRLQQNQAPEDTSAATCAQPCSDNYKEACTVNGKAGTKSCHKKGCNGGSGVSCEWGAGSYCEGCVANPTPTPPPGTPPPTTPPQTPPSDPACCGGNINCMTWSCNNSGLKNQWCQAHGHQCYYAPWDACSDLTQQCNTNTNPNPAPIGGGNIGQLCDQPTPNGCRSGLTCYTCDGGVHKCGPACDLQPAPNQNTCAGGAQNAAKKIIACGSANPTQPIAACGGKPLNSIRCGEGCQSGYGKACTVNGYTGLCVQADACGNLTGGDGTDGAFGSIGFIGCGDVARCANGSLCGDGNKCHNCYLTCIDGTDPGDDINETTECHVPVTCYSDLSSCGANTECFGTQSGPSTTGGTSTGGTGGTTSPPPQSTPFCGDAVCHSGELCERTTANGSTFRACTGTGGAPTGATVAACYGVQFNQPVAAATCKYCGDSVFTSGQEQCDPTAPAGSGNNPTQCNSSCQLLPSANQCVDLVESQGADPIVSGTGNFVDYTLIYNNSSSTDPYPNIRLRVGPSSGALGRDANNTASALVAPIPAGGVVHDSVANTWTYRFRWEAVSTAGAVIPNGTYDVRVLLDGITDLTSPAACTETIQVSSSAQESPLFDILKQSAAVCVNGGNQQINYTITVSNVGPVTGTIDFVRDTLDSNVVALGISPTNINPAFGTYASGVITWTGTVADRTFTTGQVKQYTYMITIPQNQLINFVSTGVRNQALVQYDTPTSNDNTDSFDVRTFMNCTINGIPTTGILDDPRLFLVGIAFMILGYMAYKHQFGKNISEILLTGIGEKVNRSVVGLEYTNFEDSMMYDIEEKIKKSSKTKKRKK